MSQRKVYILLCSDTTYYTGITTDLDRRISEHNSSALGAKYTRARRPVQLVRSCDTENRSTATSLELKIKAMSKTKKKALVEAGGDVS